MTAKTAAQTIAKTDTLRSTMVATAARWLPQRGMAAINLVEVARAVNAPRGSIYHYFPRGRDQLLQEALALAANSGLRMIDKALRHSITAAEFVQAMFRTGPQQLDIHHFSGGCPIGAALLSSETESPSFKTDMQAIVAGWHSALAAAFVALGASQTRATQLARCTLMAYEGALVCAKAERNMRAANEAFELAESMVLTFLRASD